MGHLEPLQAVAALRLLADHVEHRVDELSTLGVMSLRPVVACSGLAEDEVVRTEELAERARAHGVHGTRLEVHQDGTWYVAVGSIPCSSLITSQNFAPICPC